MNTDFIILVSAIALLIIGLSIIFIFRRMFLISFVRNPNFRLRIPFARRKKHHPRMGRHDDEDEDDEEEYISPTFVRRPVRPVSPPAYRPNSVPSFRAPTQAASPTYTRPGLASATRPAASTQYPSNYRTGTPPQPLYSSAPRSALTSSLYRPSQRQQPAIEPTYYPPIRTGVSATYDSPFRPAPRYQRIDRIIEEKRQRFLDLPSIGFHFADAEQIKNFYHDYFREPAVQELVSEVVGEITGNATGELSAIAAKVESQIGGKDINKWISTARFEGASLSGMFLQYQRETISRWQVTLGIEELDIELSDMNAFEDILDDLSNNFDITLDKDLIEEYRVKIKAKAAEKTLLRLEQANGWVLLEGRFLITKTNEGYFMCTYVHPVSEYLENHEKNVTISVLVPPANLEPRVKGNYDQSIGRLIPLRVYGNVWQPLDRSTGVWNLQITPLAIY